MRLLHRGAAIALTVFAIVAAFDTVLAIGHYEDDITVYTHGQADLQTPMFAFLLFEHLLDMVGLEAGTGRALLWWPAFLVALAAVTAWLARARPSRTDRAVHGWLGAALGLTALSVLHQTVAAPPSPSIGGALTDRPFAYSLWALSTIAVAAAALAVRRADSGSDSGSEQEAPAL